jgi:hypothetical protein
MTVTELSFRKNFICSIIIVNTRLRNFMKVLQTLNCRYRVTCRHRCEGTEVASTGGSFFTLHGTHNSWSLFSVLLKTESVYADATKAYGVERRCIVTHFLPRHQIGVSFQFIPNITLYDVWWYILQLANTREVWEENSVTLTFEY